MVHTSSESKEYIIYGRNIYRGVILEEYKTRGRQREKEARVESEKDRGGER